MHFDDPAPVEAFRELLLMLVAGVSVSTQFPPGDRMPHVRLDFVGGRPSNAVTDSPRFGIQVYAADGVQAERLAGQIKTALMGRSWRGLRSSRGHMFKGWQFESIMKFDDPARPTLARWQILGRFDVSMLRPE